MLKTIWYILTLTTPIISFSQVYTWEMDSCHSTTKREIEVYEKLAVTGFNYHNNILSISNIEAWKYFLKSKDNRLIIDDHVWTAEELKTSFLTQFEAKHTAVEAKAFKKYLNNLRNKTFFGKPIRRSHFINDTYVIDTLSYECDFTIEFLTNNKLTAIDFKRFDPTLPSSLPTWEDSLCSPFLRSSMAIEVKDQLSMLKYRNYRPRPVENFKHQFSLYFDKNSVAYDQTSVNAIVDFLEQENLTINHAAINAYASVEGTYEGNQQLHERRANVLMRAMQPFNEDEVLAEVKTAENWDLYREQLHLIGEHYWDEYSREEIKGFLTKDSISNAHEPYLKLQRYAELDLTLSRRLTREQQTARIQRDYYKMQKLYYIHQMNGAYVRGRMKPKLLYCLQEIESIKLYAIKMLNADKLKYEDVAYLWEDVNYKEEVLADFYTLRKAFREGSELRNVPTQRIITNAYKMFRRVSNINKLNTRDPNFIKSMVILNETFNLIKKGILDDQFIFTIEYPKSIAHAHLEAARLDFINRYDIVDEGALMKAKRPKPYTKEWLFSADGLKYYALLKNLVGVRIKEVRGEERLITNNRPDIYFQFDLLELMIFNIVTWNPRESEQRYDADITPEFMHELVFKLMKENKKLCPDQVYTLVMDFHLKFLFYQQQLGAVTTQTWKSYDFIKNYYSSNTNHLDEYTMSDLRDLLLTYNCYDYFNRPHRDVIALEKRIASKAQSARSLTH